jgi:hypothetical protein
MPPRLRCKSSLLHLSQLPRDSASSKKCVQISGLSAVGLEPCCETNRASWTRSRNLDFETLLSSKSVVSTQAICEHQRQLHACLGLRAGFSCPCSLMQQRFRGQVGKTRLDQRPQPLAEPRRGLSCIQDMLALRRCVPVSRPSALKPHVNVSDICILPRPARKVSLVHAVEDDTATLEMLKLCSLQTLEEHRLGLSGVQGMSALRRCFPANQLSAPNHR